MTINTFRLIESLPIVSESYFPTFWCWESRLQSVVVACVRDLRLSRISYSRQMFTFKDGGEVGLDWAHPKDKAEDKGDEMVGTFVDGLLEGKGVCQYASGARYEGEWRGGVREGGRGPAGRAEAGGGAVARPGAPACRATRARRRPSRSCTCSRPSRPRSR